MTRKNYVNKNNIKCITLNETKSEIKKIKMKIN